MRRALIVGAGVVLLAAGGLTVWLLNSGGSSNTVPPGPTTPPLVSTTYVASPRTITVQEYDIGFRLSKSTVPAGKITFKQVNTGQIVHNFDLVGVKVGPYLNTGGVATFAVTLKPGQYHYQCDVKEHAAAGMKGTITVTKAVAGTNTVQNEG
jgi:plastocyanin